MVRETPPARFCIRSCKPQPIAAHPSAVSPAPSSRSHVPLTLFISRPPPCFPVITTICLAVLHCCILLHML